MEIKIYDNKYRIFEKLDDTFPFFKTINRGLNIAKNALSICNFGIKEHKKINLKIYAYDDENVNAFALKEKDSYIIGISFGLFIETEKWIQHWFNLPEFDYIIIFDDKNGKKTFCDNVFSMTLCFVVMHEYYHILDGHCDYPLITNSFLDEFYNFHEETNNSSNDSFLNNLSQILEYDADFGAINACVSIIMKNNISEEQKIALINILFLSIYNIFLLFNNIDNNNFDTLILNNLKRYNHPPAGIRIAYCISFVTCCLQDFWESQKIINIIGQILNQCVSLDKLLMKSIKFKQCLYSIAYTRNGVEHIMFLNNLWGDIREDLKKYAYIELRDCEEIESMMYFVDENGNLKV